MNETATASFQARVCPLWGRSQLPGRGLPPVGPWRSDSMVVDPAFARACLAAAGPGGNVIRDKRRFARLDAALMDMDSPFRTRDDWYLPTVAVGFWMTSPGLENVTFTFKQQ